MSSSVRRNYIECSFGVHLRMLTRVVDSISKGGAADGDMKEPGVYTLAMEVVRRQGKSRPIH